MMDVDKQPNMREGQMSDGWSFGSNYNPCSQSRKISIGVLAGSIAKSKTKNIRDNQTGVQISENVTPSKGNRVEHGNKTEGFTPPVIKKNVAAADQHVSPWVSTRSSHRKFPSSAEVHSGEQPLRLPIKRKVRTRSMVGKGATAMYPVQFFGNETLATESNEVKQKKFHMVISESKAGKDVSSGIIERSSLPADPNILQEQVIVEDKSARGSETLKMKLWEILGNVSSPNKQCHNSQPVSMGPKDKLPDQQIDPVDRTLVKQRQNSDTIESDSERPDDIVRRPLISSLNRKFALNQLPPYKVTTKTARYYKEEPAEKNVLSFKKLHEADGGGSFPSKRKRTEGKISAANTHDRCLNEQVDAAGKQNSKRKSSSMPALDASLSRGNRAAGNGNFHCEKNSELLEPAEKQQSGSKHKLIPATEKSSPHGNSAAGNENFYGKKNIDLVEPKCGTIRKGSVQSPKIILTDQQKNVAESPKIYETGDWRHVLLHASPKNRMDSKHELQSPNLERSSSRISSPDSLPIRKQGICDDHFPADRVFYMEGIRSFKSLSAPNTKSCQPRVLMESPGGGGEVEDSPILKSNFVIEKGIVKGVSDSSPQETDPGSSEDDSCTKGFGESESFSPEIGNTEKEEFVHLSKRRLCNKKGSAENSELRFLHQNQEDELASAVQLLVLGLQRLKTKMKSVANKKSAEILSSVAEGVHLKLNEVESQMRADAVKLTSICKAKRKRLETRFQEQQEQLRVIYERFKNEIDRHLEDYRNIIEALEEHELELKGTAEKQRVAHRKLLLQTEKAIEAQINDAQSKIKVVHDLAKEKMLELKTAVAECSKNGAFLT